MQIRIVPAVLIFCFQSVVSDLPSVKVQFNSTAVLLCSGRCSGVVRWSISRNRSVILAECDQTSCRSMKEGYQMIYNQYLQGDLSLIISEADFSKRNWYTCDCDGKEICDVSLRLEPPEFSQQMKAGDSLTLDFPVSEPVKVMFSRAGGTNADPVKVFKGQKTHCDPAYEERAVFGLQLKELKKSDSGVYTLEDTKNKEVVSIYNITVTGEEKTSQAWTFWEKVEFHIGLGVGVGLGLFLAYFGLPQVVRLCRWLKRRVRCLRGGEGDNTPDATAAGGGGQSPPGSEHVPLKEPVSD